MILLSAATGLSHLEQLVTEIHLLALLFVAFPVYVLPLSV